MENKLYIRTWALFSLFLIYEYICLRTNPEWSLLRRWDPDVSTEAGRPLSIRLGWAGIFMMLLMNVYSIRKRWRVFDRYWQVWRRGLSFIFFAAPWVRRLSSFTATLRCVGLWPLASGACWFRLRADLWVDTSIFRLS